MGNVNDKSFNSVFISYSSKDKEFTQRFREKLQTKLGATTDVWIDDKLLEGKDWRQEIQLRLNSTALVVVILSPDSIKSPWVLYRWHYSLLVQQSEPFLVHFRKCRDKDLKRFTDYQLPQPLVTDNENVELVQIDKILERIAERLHNLSELRKQYDILTNTKEDPELQKLAAYNLGNVSDGLKLAAANYLIEALQFWLSHGVYGPVGASISNELGRLGKKKATTTLVQFFLSQVNGEKTYWSALNSVERALGLLSCEEVL